MRGEKTHKVAERAVEEDLEALQVRRAVEDALEPLGVEAEQVELEDAPLPRLVVLLLQLVALDEGVDGLGAERARLDDGLDRVPREVVRPGDERARVRPARDAERVERRTVEAEDGRERREVVDDPRLVRLVLRVDEAQGVERCRQRRELLPARAREPTCRESEKS